VQLVDGAEADEAGLATHANSSVARYKLPKAWVFTDSIQRSPSGKADYRWAKEVAAAAP
jgi:acyl-CoA synthetase (AMP-forming)/AMP-acid ligase II